MAKETGAESQIPAAYRWDQLTAKSGIELKKFYKELLTYLGENCTGRVREIYQGSATNIDEPKNLEKIITTIDGLDWYSAREEGLGNLYEGLLEKNANEKKSGAGQYFTPRVLIDVMTRLMKPQPGERCNDPACGTFGFMIAAHRYVKEHTDDFYDLDADQAKFEREEAFTGCELVHDTHRLALMNAIHNDPGRVLSGLNGEDLANSKENLVFTNASLNSSMGATKENEDVVEIPDYISKHPELPEETKNRMMCEYNRAKKAYEAKLAHAYYLSPKFKKDLAYAAGNVGLQMGIRQVLGFVFAEMWFSVKEEFQKFNERDVTLKDYLEAVAHGIQTGLEGFKEKYPELASKFLSGAVAGALSSLTTTLCNIFFTTAKNTVRIIRQSYASLVEAMKVLFINPDDYEFGDRMRAVIKVLSVGASVTVGVLVSDAVAHTPLGALGKTGDIVQNFCGAFVTGIMSCTLLMYLDRSELMNTLVQRLNDIHTIETELNYYREWAKYFEQYAAQLMQIDLDQFEKEGEAFRAIASRLDDIQTEGELNQTLKQAFASRNLPLPWADFPDFNTFMSDKSAHLVFQ